MKVNTIPQKQALEVIKEKAKQIPERYAGYRLELLGRLVDIIELERNRPHNFSQQITSNISSLGEKIDKLGDITS